MIGRIAQIAKIAKKYNRLVYPSSRYVMDGFTIGKDLGFIKDGIETLQNFTTKIEEGSKDQQIIITTGVEGEMFSGIYRMIHGEHPVIKIEPGDGVILSTASVQGNSPMLVETMNELIRQGATIYQTE
jgi:ribonuclease J